VTSFPVNPFAGRADKKRAAKLSAAKTDDNAAEKGALTGDTLKPGERYLLHDFSGVLKPGEAMLVVGRPGSGCTTFMKTLAGITQGYAGVDGTVRYGTLDKKGLRPYAKQVVFSSEDDIH
jgi:ATP-binding cassette subfamily G (WHITE) protein 2 (SNQ2)